jgi:hypothetical protein
MINKFHNFITESKNENWWEKHIHEIQDTFIEYKDEGILHHIEIGSYNTQRSMFNTINVTSLRLQDSSPSIGVDFLNKEFEKGYLLAFKIHIEIPIEKGHRSNLNPSLTQSLIPLDVLKRMDFIKDCSQLEDEWDIMFDLNSNSENCKPITILLILK